MNRGISNRNSRWPGLISILRRTASYSKSLGHFQIHLADRQLHLELAIHVYAKGGIPHPEVGTVISAKP